MQLLTVNVTRCKALRFSQRPLVRPPPRRCAHVSRVTFPGTTFGTFDPAALEESEGIREEDFVREFDAALNNANYRFQVGQRVEGYVFDVDDSGVFVDIGGKEIGVCSSQKLALVKVPHPIDIIQPETRRTFEIGATGIKSKQLGGEITLLSRVDIVKEIAFKRLRQMNEFQIKFQVEVTRKNMGGYVVVDDMGLPGFLPGRQALVNPASSSTEDDALIGTKITVKILDLFEESSRYLVTQRGVLHSAEEEARFALGSVLEGTVEGVMTYGAFVNVGGISGLLHKSQITGAHLTDVGSVFSEGDRVKAMVLGFDRTRGRLALSTARLEATSGDMLKDPQKVYDNAEEMAELFKKQVEATAARLGREEAAPVTGDVTVNTSRLG